MATKKMPLTKRKPEFQPFNNLKTAMGQWASAVESDVIEAAHEDSVLLVSEHMWDSDALIAGGRVLIDITSILAKVDLSGVASDVTMYDGHIYVSTSCESRYFFLILPTGESYEQN